MSNKNLPKVSIIIPVYNGANYLKEAIESAISQTYKNLEIIVVNDGSNDNGKTDKICRSYGNKIKYFIKENGGPASALNLGIEKMNGEYFSWLSHDDLYYPQKVENQVKFIEKYSNEKVIIYADYDLIDKDSKLISKISLNHELLMKKPEYSLLRGVVNGITLLIPKKAFEEYGNFDIRLKCTQDYDLWNRLTKTYRFIHMNQILTKTRIHALQDSNKHPNVIKEGNLLWIKMMKNVPLDKKIELEGSEYNFYREMSLFLKKESPYLGALEFAKKKMDEIFHNLKDKMESQKVTIIIPFYNRVPLLFDSLKSVESQSHKNLEILLINDGSTDNLQELKKYIKKDTRIKLINVEKNKGAAAARNIGIEKSSGDFIAFLDSDDLFKKEKIQTQLVLMVLTQSNISHTSYIRRGCGKDVIIESGKTSGRVIPDILSSCPIATPTVMLRSDYLKKSHVRYREDFRIGEDVCFWLEILRNNDLLGIEEPFTVVNVNTDSAYNNLEKQLLGLTNILNFILADKEYRQYHVQIANLCRGFFELSHKIEVKNNTNLNSNISQTWSLSNPSSIPSRLIYLFKYQGVFLTVKKIFRKYTPIVLNKLQKSNEKTV